MKYAKEKMFLELLPDYLVKDLISFNIWDDLEKKIIEGIYIKKKTIVSLSFDLPYEKTRLYEIYNSGILKLKKWLKTTENINIKGFTRLLFNGKVYSFLFV